MRRKTKIYNDGFTLIELMIVIAILGILASIALSSFIGYRQKAFDAEAKSDAINFYTMAISHATGVVDLTFDSTHPPDGYTGSAPKNGSFVYLGSSGTITCDAEFYHIAGTRIFALNDNGGITQILR